MNGAHDVGGSQSFGALPIEDEEPLFHSAWERRVFGLTLAMGATRQWNLDTSRSVREALPPATYLSSSYYEIWFEGLLILLERRGLLTADERRAIDRGAVAVADSAAAGALDSAPAGEPDSAPVGAADSAPGASAITPALPGDAPAPRVVALAPERVAPMLAAGAPTSRPGPASAYALGQCVRVRLMNPIGHTRAPRYLRGRTGTIVFDHGPHVLPDANAGGRGEQPEPLYTVRFAAVDLWGGDTTAEAVHADCWESYLEPVADAAGGPR